MNKRPLSKKATEKALKESKERFELAMRFSNVGLFDWNLETNQIYFSPEWKSLVGYDDHEIKNELSEWERLTRPHDFEVSRELLAEVLERKRDRYENEFQMRHKNGYWIDILSRANVVFDAEGKGVRVVGTHMDITELKRGETAVRERESLHIQARKVAKLGYWELILPSDVPTWCDELFDILGLDRHTGAPPFSAHKDFIHPEDWDFYNLAVTKAITDDVPFDIDFRFIKPDGAIRWMNAKGEVEKDSEGNLIRLFGAMQDITKFKSVELTLTKSERHYREIFESISDVFYRTDRKGRFLIISPSSKKVLGYEPDELVGSQLADLYINPEQNEHFLMQLNEKEEVFEFESALKAKDGSTVWVSTNAHFCRDKKGKVVGVQGISRDVTKRKRTEAEKGILEKQFLQTQKMEAIETLAEGIAHDFNNILTSAIGFTELALLEAKESTSLQKCLQEVHAAGNRAKDLVRQIMTFAQRSDDEPKPVRVDIIAEEELKLLRATIPSSIHITENFDSDSLVMASAAQIHQIFMNLCTNAAQAMEDETGAIEVHLTDIEVPADDREVNRNLPPGDYLKIVVRDMGKGIPEEHLESVFLPYFTTKGIGGGTGIGLSVVHGIVKKCGGEIFVESEAGKGTAFTVYLPIAEKSSMRRDQVQDALLMGREAILFVDDEMPIVEMTSQILESLGYRVTARTDSAEALEVFRSTPEAFDLVITDMAMPGMTGDKLASELVQIKPRIPIIVCTGHSKRISAEKAAAIGIKTLCMKPISKADLARTVRKVLDDVTMVPT